MSDDTKAEKRREQAKVILQMTKEAKRVANRIGADSVIVIGIFKDDITKQLTLQDAGGFPSGMTPDVFYNFMSAAHENGQMSLDGPKVKSKILRPN